MDLINNDIETSFTENGGERCFITLSSSFTQLMLGSNSEEAKQKFDQIASLNSSGQLFLLLPSQTGVIAIVSESSAFCVNLNIDDPDNSFSYDRYLNSLIEQGAYVSLIDYYGEKFISAINGELVEFLIKTTTSKFNKYKGIPPESIFIKVTDQALNKTMITNNAPSENKEFYFEINSRDQSKILQQEDIKTKIDSLTKTFKEIHPNFSLSFSENEPKDETKKTDQEISILEYESIFESDFNPDEANTAKSNAQPLTSKSQSFDKETVFYTDDMLSDHLRVMNNKSDADKQEYRILMAYFYIWKVNNQFDIPSVSSFWNSDSYKLEDFEADRMYIQKSLTHDIDERYQQFLF